MSEYKWKTVSVVGFDELMQALDRADHKGFMPDAIKEQWEAFNWKPAQQGPEYWLWACGQHIQVSLEKPEFPDAIPLYTCPQAREWVGLTDNEIALIHADYPHPQGYARAIEAKLKEKNS